MASMWIIRATLSTVACVAAASPPSSCPESKIFAESLLLDPDDTVDVSFMQKSIVGIQEQAEAQERLETSSDKIRLPQMPQSVRTPLQQPRRSGTSALPSDQGSRQHNTMLSSSGVFQSPASVNAYQSGGGVEVQPVALPLGERDRDASALWMSNLQPQLGLWKTQLSSLLLQPRSLPKPQPFYNSYVGSTAPVSPDLFPVARPYVYPGGLVQNGILGGPDVLGWPSAVDGSDQQPIPTTEVSSDQQPIPTTEVSNDSQAIPTTEVSSDQPSVPTGQGSVVTATDDSDQTVYGLIITKTLLVFAMLPPLIVAILMCVHFYVPHGDDYFLDPAYKRIYKLGKLPEARLENTCRFICYQHFSPTCYVICCGWIAFRTWLFFAFLFDITYLFLWSLQVNGLLEGVVSEVLVTVFFFCILFAVLGWMAHESWRFGRKLFGEIMLPINRITNFMEKTLDIDLDQDGDIGITNFDEDDDDPEVAQRGCGFCVSRPQVPQRDSA